MNQILHALLENLIDYAGLFPPAKLDMAPAVENYNRYLYSEFAFALGRFICPVSRLDEFSAHAAPLMPGTFATSGYREMATQRDPWRLSVIIDAPLDSSLAAIDSFNELHTHEDQGLATIDTLEMRIEDPNDFDEALDIIPNDIKPYFEIPLAKDPRGMVAALAGEDACAKARLGGITPDAIPSIDPVARFIAACNAAHVPFKATAGLHHPIRAVFPLTYEQNPPRSTMHGFVNVFLAAAMISENLIDESDARSLLAETDPSAFSLHEQSISWAGCTLDINALRRARTRFAQSYGSCSFEEPIADLKTLGWIQQP